MNKQQLAVFMEICSGRTLLETADKLGLKQPTVSFHLRKLEETLGMELVYKSARKLRPTEAAMDLLPYARRIVALAEEMEEFAAERRERGGGKLRLGASNTPATYYLAPYFSLFQQRHPQIQLLLSVKKADAVLAMLRNYEIEVAVVSLPETTEKGLAIHTLAEDELKLVMSPEHPLAKMETVRTQDLHAERFLLHEPGSTSRRLTDEWAERTGLHFGPVMELGAIEAMKEAVKCNIGIAVLPQRSIVRETASGELVQHDLPDYHTRQRICLVYRDEDVHSTNVRLFVQLLKTGLAQE